MARYKSYYSKFARGPALALALGTAVAAAVVIDAENNPVEACTLTTYKHPNKPLSGPAKGKRFYYYQGFEWTTSPDPNRRRHIRYNGTVYEVKDTAKSAWDACMRVASAFLKDTSGARVKIKLDGCRYDRKDPALRENRDYCGKTATIGGVPPSPSSRSGHAGSVMRPDRTYK